MNLYLLENIKKIESNIVKTPEIWKDMDPMLKKELIVSRFLYEALYEVCDISDDQIGPNKKVIKTGWAIFCNGIRYDDYLGRKNEAKEHLADIIKTYEGAAAVFELRKITEEREELSLFDLLMI